MPIINPLPLGHSSLSPELTHVNLPSMDDPASVSPTVTAAVTNLLSSFDNYSDVLIPTVQPNTINGKSFGQKKPGWTPSNFHPFIHLPFFQDLRFSSSLKSHQNI